jgi:uncharacterized protein YuzE
MKARHECVEPRCPMPRSVLHCAMRTTFDPAADAAYFYLVADVAPGAAVEQVVVSRDGKGDVVLDFDVDGHLLGVEVIGASGLLDGATLAGAERL